MDYFRYDDGRLRCEEVDLGELAARAGTPTYIYSRATFALHYDRIAEAFAPLNPLICYSVKSCSNVHILKVLAERGAGMDVVSGGELHRTRLAGVPGSKVLYAGVGKTETEIRDALGAGLGAEPIGTFNIESEPEFQVIANIARAMNVQARAALRVNPDVDAHTHAYTTTGTAETKFGVDLTRAREFFARYGRHSHLRLTGVHLHLGSPINSTAPYVEAIRRALALMDTLAKEGFEIDTLDVGGGFAADYTTGNSLDAAAYAAAIVPLLRDRVTPRGGGAGLRLIIEPGRTISANAGVLLTRVQYVKRSGLKKFIVCDAGMQTLIRPSLYGAFHFIWPAAVAPQHTPERRAEKLDLPGLEVCDVVGPICESGDFLAKDRSLPPVARGDLLAVFAAGAYGMSMASRYNSQPFPAEVLIDGTRATVIRRRETYDDLVRDELSPTDLGV
jgi:diaminopimelate decarboxylase